MRQFWWIALAVIVVLAAFFATGVRVFMPAEWGAPVSWWRTFSYNLAHFAIWAALAPLLWRLARALPIDRRRWRWSVPIQIAASCAVAIGQLVLAELALSPFLPDGDPVRPALVDAIRFSLAINFQAAIMTYWAICGAAYAYMFHRREVAATEHAAAERFRTLESHVAPHFLFNTLNSVAALVDGDPTDAKRLLADLGDLLRDSLAARDLPMLPLDRELAVVARYLDIEQARFADRLLVEIDANGLARGCEVPAFLLQPLVENAIRHGLQPSIDPVTIAVRAHLVERRLSLEVCDDARAGDRSASSEGLGLQRTKARLEHCYGATHAFSAGRTGERGFRVAIEIPARPAAEALP